MNYIYDWLFKLYNVFAGFLVYAVSYFIPIKDMIFLVTALFIADVLIGSWKSIKIDKMKFEPKIVWDKTMPRWLFSVIILSFLFASDKVHHQDYIKTYYAGGYFISGAIMLSIIDNMIEITQWGVFKGLKNIIGKNVEKQTGEKIEKNETEK